MKEKITITEKEWEDKKEFWSKWQQSFFITKWEHDFIKKIYIIEYERKS